MASFETDNNKKNPNWSTRVTYLYLVVIALSILALIFIVFLTFKWWLSNEGDGSNLSDLICTTPGCYRIASRILQNMNPTVNPCENFAEFACGSVYKSNPVRLKWKSTLTGLGNRIMNVILQKQDVSDPDYFHLPKRLYEKCMTTIKLENSNILSYVKVLNHLDIPLLKNSSWNDNNTWSWQADMHFLRKWGHDFNFFFNLDTNALSADLRYYLSFSAPPSSSLNDEAFILLMKRYFEPVVEDKHILSQDLQDVSNFRRDLKETISRDTDSKIVVQQIKTLQTYLSFMNASEYINGLLPAGTETNEVDEIVIKNTEFFKGLGQLLERHTNRTIANYIACRIIESSSEFLPHYEYRFVKRLQSKHPSPRDVKCKDAVRKHLRYVLTKLFLRQYHAEPIKKAVSLIATDLQKAYDRILNRTEWLDAVTKEALRLKLHLIQFSISHTEESVNASYLSKLYGNVDVEDNYLGICCQLQKKKWDQKLSQLKSVMSLQGRFDAQGVDALDFEALYLKSTADQVVHIYLGILDQQFYIDAPEYINLATVGWMIGHEITHAFDSNNMRFDAYRNSVTYPNEFYQHYEERVQCLVQQYNGFQERAIGLMSNGSLTIAENIADNGGLAVTYEAYVQSRQRNSPEKLLPGLTKFTQSQIFWLAAAQFYCNNYSEDELEDNIHFDSHSIDEFRIIGPFQNSANFSKDFKCMRNDKMNPDKKCAIFQ